MKCVIYTALTGGYDNLIQPKSIAKDFDYICFTNNDMGAKVGAWNIQRIPYITDDLQRLSRFPKMHPHILLADYDYSLYIDANVCIENDDFYDIIRRKIKEGAMLSGVKHPLRDDVYEEFWYVWILRKEKNLKVMRKEYQFLLGQGFPRKYGMYEANIILRNHHDATVIKQCEEWWHLVNLMSKRDQLSYSYTLWKYHIPFDFMFIPGAKRENLFYSVVNHPSSKSQRRFSWENLVCHAELFFFEILKKDKLRFIKRLFYGYLKNFA